MSIRKAIDLVTPYRFDLVLKYLYAKAIVKGYNTTFFKDMYKKHLELWNGFREYDNPKIYGPGFQCSQISYNELLLTDRIPYRQSSFAFCR